MGLAVGQMRRPRCVCIVTHHFGLVIRNIDLVYFAPSEAFPEDPIKVNPPQEDRVKPRFHLGVGDLYNLSEDVVATWNKSIGMDLI